MKPPKPNPDNTARDKQIAALKADFATPMLAPRRPLWRLFQAGFESATRSLEK